MHRSGGGWAVAAFASIVRLEECRLSDRTHSVLSLSSAPLAMHMKNVHHISQNNAGTPLRLSMRALDLRNRFPWSAARKHKARLLKVDEYAEPRYAARLIDTAQTSARLANACH
jgi:hypothetical protein